jgi:hypothetical protein
MERTRGFGDLEGPPEFKPRFCHICWEPADPEALRILLSEVSEPEHSSLRDKHGLSPDLKIPICAACRERGLPVLAADLRSQAQQKREEGRGIMAAGAERLFPGMSFGGASAKDERDLIAGAEELLENLVAKPLDWVAAEATRDSIADAEEKFLVAEQMERRAAEIDRGRWAS